MQQLGELLVLLMTAIFGLFTPAESLNPTLPTAARETATVVRVIDGDTIVVNLNGSEEKVRYVGVDTPELERNGRPVECQGEAARDFNEQLVLGQSVTLERDMSDRDQYDRLLRYVYAEDVLVQESLVEAGLAEVFYYQPDTSKYKALKAVERTARENEAGIWGSCQ